MEFTPEKKEIVTKVATDALSRLSDIAEAAERALGSSGAISSDALVDPHAANARAALENLSKSSLLVRASHEQLTREPAIARVVVFDSKNQERIYYICRTSPVSGVKNLASYRSPVGRLASIAIGESIVIPNGEELEVLERAILHPVKEDDEWDSTRTVIVTDDFGPVTIASLREVLKSLGDIEQVEDILEQIQAEEKLSESLVSGLQRSVITKMGLRDQPILNSIQDAIFRLPLDSQLILLGPPGTGKTTTLIRRLGQKLDHVFLTDDEKDLVAAAKVAEPLSHEESWLMFTPTKLLRLYLKEAFSREQVPALMRGFKLGTISGGTSAKTSFPFCAAQRVRASSFSEPKSPTCRRRRWRARSHGMRISSSGSALSFSAR